MPPRFQRPYPPECRREAIRLVQATGRRYQDVAVELGISGESLRKRIKQAELDRGDRSDGLTSSERDYTTSWDLTPSQPGDLSTKTDEGHGALG